MRERVRIKPERHRIIRPTNSLTILDAIADPQLFGPWFKKGKTWAAWLAFLAALFALPMSADQMAVYRKATKRDEAPSEIAKEAWLVCGRRAGKSFILALIAVFLACFHDYRRYLAPGERGMVLIIASDRKQARVIVRYIKALLTCIPMLARLIEREWTEGFDLSNSVTIEVGTASFRSVRGYTIVAALLDELAFWPTEDSAEPDFEIIAALRPGMATIPNAMLLCASSPYARRGALWDAYRRHFGRDGDPILVWQADTRTMNPTVPQSIIDEAMAADAASASAEFLAHFRDDIESFITREAVQACVAEGVIERPYSAKFGYRAFVDTSGGGKDSFTLAIGHSEGQRIILDAVRERKPPFSPEDVVVESSDLLRSYSISKVSGDRYAGEWPRERFRSNGVAYDPATKAKSDLYRELLPTINSRSVDLLDNERLLKQIVGLERRTARGGRDSIDHAPGGHDDLANAIAGLVANLIENRSDYDTSLSWVGDDDADWRRMRLHNFINSGGNLR